MDVIDSIAALYWAQAEGIATAANSIAMGGSSAGLTVLAILRAAKDLLAGGVVLYPVTDIVRLAESTHRFEERYFDKLIGRLSDQLATYEDELVKTEGPFCRLLANVSLGQEFRESDSRGPFSR